MKSQFVEFSKKTFYNYLQKCIDLVGLMTFYYKYSTCRIAISLIFSV